MGISGLLPALKPIHKTKHLSEFAGQTIAVDAYGWLHKAVYSCATDVATGKPTHKYVDSAMHRVRLLRHFGIEPYIVFDGGPLPAKRGTELDRKQRREENLARGNALTAQGRHTQARDCYVKCVDVTPEMAYQFIKALRAENVQYVVAPYEADAQMAYLERIGLVNGILTEDSDLLVFGCVNVLVKFDFTANTVCHISRHDFGSVTSTASDTSIINLHGWNDAQFRAMTILSGCDYLPSIPGIGLKTANNLLRKWKTAEGVVRAIMLEGKKSVPNGYLKKFNLAESCFKFQRVYDPLEEKLVHLTPVEGELDEETDAYVGEDLQPELAKRIAMGDADPITRQPMEDINPGFKPTSKSLSGASNLFDRKNKGKAKTSGEGLLSFFGPNPIIPRERPASTKPSISARALSGKKTLGEVMDQDIARRKQPNPHPIQSKFFTTATPPKTTSKRRSEDSIAGPSQRRESRDNKENVYAIDDDDEILSMISLKANVSPTQDLDFDLDLQDGVEQEDGYISPLSNYSQETQDLSSPVRHMFSPLKKKKRRSSARHSRDVDNDVEIGDGSESVRFSAEPRRRDMDEFDVEPVSSPVEFKRRRSHSPCSSRSYGRLRTQTPVRSFSTGNILVASTPTREFGGQESEDALTGLGEIVPQAFNGPDLQSCLDGEGDDGSMDGSEEEWNSQTQQSMEVNFAAERRPRVAVGACANTDKSVKRGNNGLMRMASESRSVSPLSPPPQTPLDNRNSRVTIASVSRDCVDAGNVNAAQERDVIDVDAWDMEMQLAMDGPQEEAEKIQAERVKNVAQGWRMKWALGQIQKDLSSSSTSTAASISGKGKQKPKKRKQEQSALVATGSKLRRSETNITPLGKHSLARLNQPREDQRLAWSAPHKLKHKFKDLSTPESGGKASSTGTRRQLLRQRSSLVFFADKDASAASSHKEPSVAKATRLPKPEFRESRPQPMEYGWLSDPGEIMDVPSDRAQMRLDQFRFQLDPKAEPVLPSACLASDN